MPNKPNNRKAVELWRKFRLASSVLLVLSRLLTIDDGGLVAQQQTQSTAALHEELDARYHDFERGAISEVAFTNAVIAVSADQANIKDSLSALQTQRARITGVDNSTQLNREIAMLAEMTAQYDVAIDSYRQIAQHAATGSAERADALLKLATLYFNNGDFSDALSATQQVLVGATDKSRVHRAYILQIRIEGYAVNFPPAIQKLTWFIEQNADSPELRLAYVVLVELHHRHGDSDKAEQIQQTLSERFPSSIEARYNHDIGAQKIMSIPLPVILLRKSEENIFHDYGYAFFDQQPERNSDSNDGDTTARSVFDGAPVKIQTGSFKSREYAESLQGRLETLGLKTVIDTVSQADGVRHKVRVLTTDRAYSSVLDTLSVHNINGFLTSD